MSANAVKEETRVSSVRSRRGAYKTVKTVLFYAGVILAAFLFTLPIINLIGSSFKDGGEIMSNNGLFPHHPTLENYRTVLMRSPFGRYIRNSFLIAVTVAVIVAAFASLAGYAISRYANRIRFFRYYSSLFLLLQMFPGILMLIPQILIFNKMGLANTLFGLMLIYTAGNLPFCTWMISGFFDGIPVEMEEAAQIDGCNVYQSFLRLVLPLSTPGIASIIIFTFIGCWNEFMVANVFMKDENLRTIPVGLQTFIQQFEIQWGPLMAAAAIALIPVLIFLIFMQKYIVAGLTSGAVKG